MALDKGVVAAQSVKNGSEGNTAGRCVRASQAHHSFHEGRELKRMIPLLLSVIQETVTFRPDAAPSQAFSGTRIALSFDKGR